jgi:Tol biopolymer transport system component
MSSSAPPVLVRTRNSLLRHASAVTFLAVPVACGSDGQGAAPLPNETHTVAPGLHVRTGASVTDTIDAVQVQALVVQIADAAGKPLSGVTVRFAPSTATTGGPFPATISTMAVSRLSATTWATLVADTTDASGTAASLVRMGTLAGAGLIIVNAPTLGLVDTARFTIRVGNATRMTVVPRDTMVYVGGVARPRIVVTDRYNNVVSSAPTMTSDSGRVAPGSDGTAAGTSIGRDVVRLSAGSLRDSLLVSVVPTGTIAAYTAMQNSGDLLAIYTFNLDGSGFRRVVPTVIFAGYFGEMPPVWSTDGRTIFYHDNKGDHTRMLWSVDVASGVSQRLIRPTEQLADERYPSRSADGRWLYFNGPDFGISRAYRVHTDGTGVEAIGAAGTTQSYPHPSPDGARIVYTNFGQLQSMDLATKAVTKLGIPANAARWSPDGTSLAYTEDNGIYVSRPDGSSAKQLYRGFASPFLDWSRDGKYVVASIGGTITLLDVATAQSLPIRVSAVTHGFASPSWKP